MPSARLTACRNACSASSYSSSPLEDSPQQRVRRHELRTALQLVFDTQLLQGVAARVLVTLLPKRR